jgi:GNAT superfamily N-acetyltransferase
MNAVSSGSVARFFAIDLHSEAVPVRDEYEGEMGGIRLRQLVPEDYADWRELWDGYNDFYGRSGDAALPEEVTARTWSRFFDVDDPVHALAAEATSRVVGIAHYIFHRSTIYVADVCYLQDLFTAPEMRGRGIGEALITAVADHARMYGAERLYWQTHETNARAISLYRKLAERSGFIVFRRQL